MPKAKTVLDELARVLKAREHAVQRADRRAYIRPWGINESRGWTESENLVRNLGDKAVMEYTNIMENRPGKRVMQKAYRMMPGYLIQEHDYFDR